MKVYLYNEIGHCLFVELETSEIDKFIKEYNFLADKVIPRCMPYTRIHHLISFEVLV